MVSACRKDITELISSIEINETTRGEKVSLHAHGIYGEAEMKLQSELHGITSFLSPYFDRGVCIEKGFYCKNVGWKNNVSMGRKTNQELAGNSIILYSGRDTSFTIGIEVDEQESYCIYQSKDFVERCSDIQYR